MCNEDRQSHPHPLNRRKIVLGLVLLMFWGDDSLCLVPSRSSRYLAGTRDLQPWYVLRQFVPRKEVPEPETNTIDEIDALIGYRDGSVEDFLPWHPEEIVVDGSRKNEVPIKIAKSADEGERCSLDRSLLVEQGGGDDLCYEDDAWLETITRQLVNCNQSNNTPGTWTVGDFTLVDKVMKAWSKRPAALRPAVHQEQLLRRVIEEKLAGNPLALTLKMGNMYDAVISSWSKSFEFGAPERAEEILDAMQHAYSDGDDEDLKPTIQTWNHVLRAYAILKSKDGPQNTMRVFSKLYQLLADGQTDVRPNQESYASILEAHAHVGGTSTPELVLQILCRMQELSDAGYPTLKPDTSCHNIYLRALIARMEDDQKSRSITVRQAESYLRRMMEDPDPNAQPDNLSVSYVLSVLARSGDNDSVSKAEALVAEMDETCARISPNTLTYNCLLACYISSNIKDRASRSLAVFEKMKAMSEANPSCRPNAVTYNSIMSCIGKTSDPYAPQKVEALLEEMNDIYERTGDDSLKPTKRSYNFCLDAWARSDHREAPERILNFIKKWEDDFESEKTNVPTNTFSYNTYLQALAKQRSPSIADEAERILKVMEDRSHQLKPDVLTYTNVLHCIARSDPNRSFQRAYAIFLKMEDGDGDVRPNLYTYNVLINVVAKSKLPGKAKVAVRLLSRMKAVAIRPNAMTYNSVLNAFAYSDRATDDGDQIVDLALMVFNEARDTVGANSITYASHIRVIRYLVDNRLERWQQIRKAFRQCCADGQFTAQVLREAKAGVTKHQYELLKNEVMDERTGQWREEYTKWATQLNSQPSNRRS